MEDQTTSVQSGAPSGQGRGLLVIATPQLSEAGWSSHQVSGSGVSGCSEALLKLLYLHTLTYPVHECMHTKALPLL